MNAVLTCIARGARATALAALVALSMTPAAHAGIDGITAQSFQLTAREGQILIADGGAVYSWGYSANGTMQLPGPTLIVTEGQPVSVTLTNNLPAIAGNVSIVFPGQASPTVTGGVAGALTQEAAPGGSVTYTFTPGRPGTYQYHSGTRPDLQVEMGLYGALIVRPASPSCAYDHPATCFDREYLFLLSEIDLYTHRTVERQVQLGLPIDIGVGAFESQYWLLNGRAAPDTMAPAFSPLLPNQPYNSVPRMHPGERLLLRVVGAGREMHPFHTHGNHTRVLARDGRLLLSQTDATQLAGPLLFTIPSIPGGTVDAIFEWTGQDLGWDIYGHKAGDGTTCSPADGYDTTAREWCPDHNRPLPVTLPSLSSMAFGGFYSGSPYLGLLGSLPPGEGGLNPTAGFTYMWHSHTERELVNNDVFPGGLMTMLIVEAPGVAIE